MIGNNIQTNKTKAMEEKNKSYMEDLQDRYIRFDWAIKRLLRQKANFAVLEGFLTVFLGEKITISEILESESNQQTIDDKFNRVDIKALNSKGEIIIVEIQNARETYFMERLLYGVAKAITEHMSLGDSYRNVKKVYSISIIYFNLGKGEDYIYHGSNQFIGVHTHDHLQITGDQRGALESRYPAEIFPEYILIRVNEFNKVAVSPMEEWMSYLKDGRISPDTKAPGLSEARERLALYTMKREDRLAYERHLDRVMSEKDMFETSYRDGMIAGEKIGEQKGEERGEKNANLKVAARMKQKGLPIELIKEMTGLSEDEIEME